MADEKKPVVGRIEQLSVVPQVNKGNIVSFQSKVELPVVPVVMTAEQFARFERTLIVGFVTMGYMANGGRPTSPSKIAELADLIETVGEL